MLVKLILCGWRLGLCVVAWLSTGSWRSNAGIWVTMISCQSHFVWTKKMSPRTGCKWISPVIDWGKIHLGNRLSLATMAGSPNPLGLIRVCMDLYVWIFDSAWILLSVGFWVILNNQPCVWCYGFCQFLPMSSLTLPSFKVCINVTIWTMLWLILLCVWIFGSTWILLSIVMLGFR